MEKPVKQPKLTISEKWEILERFFDEEDAMEILMG